MSGVESRYRQAKGVIACARSTILAINGCGARHSVGATVTQNERKLKRKPMNTEQVSNVFFVIFFTVVAIVLLIYVGPFIVNYPENLIDLSLKLRRLR